MSMPPRSSADPSRPVSDAAPATSSVPGTPAGGGLPRRRVLGLGLAAMAGSAIPAHAEPSPAPATPPAAGRPAGRARNVIVMVSDGMSQGTWTLAETASRRRHGRPSAWARLLMQPGVRRGQSTTHSADALVTDSAAAGSAWGCGRKVANGAINVTPDGREHVPLLRLAAATGRRTGLVSTTEITHATPASFAANVPSRADAATIGRQLLERRIDVLLGGGAVHLPAEELAAADLRLVRRAGELRRATRSTDGGGRLVGLFADGHLPYELDRLASIPSLAAMTRAALAHLGGVGGSGADGPGFVLQVEGGRVDHAAHANDAGSLLAEQLAFDDALAVAMDFARDRDDTLLIVTTDHGNANPGLTFYGERGNRAFARLMGVRRSFDWIWSATRTRAGDGDAGSDVMLDALVTAVRDATGVEPTADDRAWLARTVVGDDPASAFDGLDSRTAALGQVLADHLGVGFVSTNHTNDLVEVVAAGPGAERLAPLIDNVDLHGLMVDAAGLRG